MTKPLQEIRDELVHKWWIEFMTETPSVSEDVMRYLYGPFHSAGEQIFDAALHELSKRAGVFDNEAHLAWLNKQRMDHEPSPQANARWGFEQLMPRVAALTEENMRLNYESEAANSLGDERIRDLESKNRSLIATYEEVCMRTVDLETYDELKAQNERLRAALTSAWGFVDAHDNVGLTRVQVREALSGTKEIK